MMRPIWVIARNTFREAVRNKILYILLLAALAMIVSGILLGRLSLDQSARVLIDVGVASISFFGVVIAVFIGVNLLYQEMDRKTLYTVLTKPISRWQFVLGKYVGMLLTLSLMTLVMTSCLLLMLFVPGVEPNQPLMVVILLSFLELAIMVSVALFFSSFSSPFLSGFFTLGVFLLGRLTDSLYEVLGQLQLGPLEDLMVGVSYLLPSLYRFSIVDYAIYGTPVPWSYVGYCLLYALCYIAATLGLACFIFSRRDIL